MWVSDFISGLRNPKFKHIRMSVVRCLAKMNAKRESFSSRLELGRKTVGKYLKRSKFEIETFRNKREIETLVWLQSERSHPGLALPCLSSHHDRGVTEDAMDVDVYRGEFRLAGVYIALGSTTHHCYHNHCYHTPRQPVLHLVVYFCGSAPWERHKLSLFFLSEYQDKD